MNIAERKEEIDRKCRMAGCDDKKAKKHAALYLARWDVHPPADFLEWYKVNGQGGNPITAWNSDVERQAFYKSKGELL